MTRSPTDLCYHGSFLCFFITYVKVSTNTSEMLSGEISEHCSADAV